MDVIWQRIVALVERPLDVILINKTVYHSLSDMDKARAVTRRILTSAFPRLKSTRTRCRRRSRRNADPRHCFRDAQGGLHWYHPSVLVAYVLGYITPATHVAVVKALFQAGAKHVDVALQMAARLGKVDMCEYLIREAKANVHHGEDISLRLASARGHPDVVKLLLSHGAAVRVRNDEALLRASSAGCPDVLRLLIAAGARSSNAALRRACSAQDLDAMSALLENGADSSDPKVINWALLLYRTGPLEVLLKHCLDPIIALRAIRQPEHRPRHVLLLEDRLPDVAGLRIAS
jgi:hypothetical protein